MIEDLQQQIADFHNEEDLIRESLNYKPREKMKVNDNVVFIIGIIIIILILLTV